MLPEAELLVVVVGFIIALALAFGIGANDVANSFGTSVGSKVLSLRSACILATIFEISGAVLLGGQVSSTIRGGIVKSDLFNETKNGAITLMYGQVASLASSCIWMLVATFFKLPVSGSHSIVGATAGFGLVLFGLNGIHWMEILRIVLSWLASPVLSGIVSSLVFFVLKKTVLTKNQPLEPALYTLPFIYGIIVLINLFSVLSSGLSIFGIRKIQLWIILVSSFGAGIVSGLVVLIFVRPYLRRKVLRLRHRMAEGCKEVEESSTSKFRRRALTFFQRLRHPHKATSKTSQDIVAQPTDDHGFSVFVHATQLDSLGVNSEGTGDENLPETSLNQTVVESSGPGLGSDCSSSAQTPIARANTVDIKSEGSPLVEDRPEEALVFSFAQVLSAVFGSFAHGANDVSNAIGPVAGLWLVAVTGDPLNSDPAPVWILLYGGVGISFGLWIWGRKVMETVGTDLTTITPSSGMCIELGSAITVLVASNLGIPVSTTHCKVGSVVCVGRIRSKSNVNWKLFLNIVIAWVVTLPVSAGLSSLIMFAFIRTLPIL